MPVWPIVERNRLVECTEGKETYYKSPEESKFDGIIMKIRKGRIQINCSPHSLYSKWGDGKRLDNSGFFTMPQAVGTIHGLFERIGVRMDEAVRVTYFEIGLNIPVKYDPIEYISMVSSIGEEGGKELFNDANFKKDRQKTTEKSSTIKKVFKIYDKGFEYRNKGKHVEGNILRVETMFRRQSIPLSTFISPDFTKRVTGRFYKDWSGISFPKRIEADIGIHSTQIEKARYIMEFGKDEYLSHVRELCACGEYSRKQGEMARAFAKEWDNIKHKFRYMSDSKEVEYMSKLRDLLTDAAGC